MLKIRLLGWMCGATESDGIMNEGIRGETGRGEICKKVQKSRLVSPPKDTEIHNLYCREPGF